MWPRACAHRNKLVSDAYAPVQNVVLCVSFIGSKRLQTYEFDDNEWHRFHQSLMPNANACIKFNNARN